MSDKDQKLFDEEKRAEEKYEAELAKWEKEHPSEDYPREGPKSRYSAENPVDELTSALPTPADEAATGYCPIDIDVRLAGKRVIDSTSGGTGISVDLVRSNFLVNRTVHGSKETFVLREVR